MGVHAGNRKEHVPGQLPLNADDKLLIVGLVDVPGQLVNLREAQNRCAIEKCRAERKRWQRREWIRIPLAQARNLAAWLANRDNTV